MRLWGIDPPTCQHYPKPLEPRGREEACTRKHCPSCAQGCMCGVTCCLVGSVLLCDCVSAECAVELSDWTTIICEQVLFY